jgi:hypothetical protein
MLCAMKKDKITKQKKSDANMEVNLGRMTGENFIEPL